MNLDNLNHVVVFVILLTIVVSIMQKLMHWAFMSAGWAGPASLFC